MIKTIKYIVLSAAVAVFTVTACTKNELEQPVGQEGVTTFTGGFIESKISLGEKDGNGYPALWEKDDKIAIYNSDNGKLIGTATLKSGAGDREGVFQMQGSIAKGTKIKVVYPADAGYTVPAQQYQSESGKSSLETQAESSEIVSEGDGSIAFSLAHRAAVVKVSINTSEFASMKLKSVLLYSKDAALTDGSDYVRLNFKSIKALSSEQTVVFTTKPVTSPADFYLAVTMAKDNKTVTIPLLYQQKTLNAAQVNLIKVNNLKTADNAVAWYNPECTRYIPEGAWSYGTANSIVVNPTAGSTVTFDVRACGDFLGVIKHGKEPKYMQLRLGDMVDTGNAGMWEIDGTTPKKKKYAELLSYTPTIRLARDPQNSKKSVIGLIELTDKDQTIIWSYLFWASAPSRVQLPKSGVYIMDRNLGGSGADALTEKEMRGTLYQWGRPFPFGQNPGSATSTSASQVKDETVRVTNYAESAAKANQIAAIADNSNADWMQTEDHINDLWGNPSSDVNSKGGPKSIFDPCPSGWKVASAEAMREVYANATWDDVSNMYVYPNASVRWPVTCFIDGRYTVKGGDSKGLYWADSPWDCTFGAHFEYDRSKDTKDKSFNGTWRSNASAVRCMADPDSNDAEGVPDVQETEQPKTFSNPVIASALADPTIWKVGEEFRITSTGLQNAYSSNNLVKWPLASSLPVNSTERALCTQHGSQIWAPDVTMVNGKYMMYITCYNSATDNSIVALESADGKHFSYVGVVTSYNTNGNIKDTIDPEVVTDPSTGKVWMFFGSTGRIHRVELNSTGTALAGGASYVPVAGLDINNNSSRSKVFEAAYLHYRDGYWYMFASAGKYWDYSYKIVVGRSKTLTGTFVDKNGASMLDGNATTVISSASGDTLFGPGHNAAIFTDRRGQDYIFYHCHCSTISTNGDDRYGCLQRIFWGEDGWPYVTGGKPAATDIVPLF